MQPQDPQTPPPQIAGPPMAQPTFSPQPTPINDPNAMPSAPSTSARTPMVLWIVIAVILAVLVGGGIVLYLLFFSTAAQTKRASSTFMHAIVTKDVTAALAQSTSSDSDTRTFITQVSQNSGTSFKLQQHAMQNGKAYFLYSLSGGKDTNGRTVVEKTNGKWLVSSYVESASSLSLIPGSSSTSSSSTTPSVSSATPAPSSSGNCLVAGDYSVIDDAAGIDYTAPGVYYSGNVHFNADSVSYDSDAVENSVLDTFAAFVKANPTKKYAINLRGSVATTAQSDLSFANQRAQKVQQDLESRGVPASRVIVDAPSNVAAFGADNNDPTNQQTARSVVLAINDPCTGSAVDAGFTAMPASSAR